MRSLLVGALAIVAATSLAACGGGGGGSPASSSSPPSALAINIVGQNGALSFNPNPASAGGQSVVFRNTDTVVHRVVLNDGSIDTGDIAPGATSRQVLMPSAGTHYHCAIHTTMVGSINAQSGGAAPPCVGAYCD